MNPLIASIILAIACIATISGMMLKGGSSQSTISVAQMQQTVNGADLINAAINRCRQVYPIGSPIAPASWPNTAVDNLVSGLVCPGAPASDNLIFSLRQGFKAPPPPSGFGEWLYVRSGVGMYLRLVNNRALSVQEQEALCGFFERKYSVGQAIADISVPNNATLTIFLMRYSTVPSTEVVCKRT